MKIDIPNENIFIGFCLLTLASVAFEDIFLTYIGILGIGLMVLYAIIYVIGESLDEVILKKVDKYINRNYILKKRKR